MKFNTPEAHWIDRLNKTRDRDITARSNGDTIWHCGVQLGGCQISAIVKHHVNFRLTKNMSTLKNIRPTHSTSILFCIVASHELDSNAISFVAKFQKWQMYAEDNTVGAEKYLKRRLCFFFIFYLTTRVNNFIQSLRVCNISCSILHQLFIGLNRSFN